MTGRFFNDESIEAGLGLHEIDEPPARQPGEEWCSICSRHQEYDADCHICRVGTWVEWGDHG